MIYIILQAWPLQKGTLIQGVFLFSYYLFCYISLLLSPSIMAETVQRGPTYEIFSVVVTTITLDIGVWVFCIVGAVS